MIAPANSSMVTGSVEGVITALATAALSSTQRQAAPMVLARIRPRAPRISCNTGS